MLRQRGLTFIMYIEYIQVILRDARSLLAPPPADIPRFRRHHSP